MGVVRCDGSSCGCVLRASGVMRVTVVCCCAGGIWCDGSSCGCVGGCLV